MDGSERIGFLGLGIMGSRMAANVVAAGYPLTVWTRTPGKARVWAAEHGADVAATPAQVARASDIVVSMVVDGAQVASILVDQDGVASGASPGLLCVDMSTIAPQDTLRIAACLRERGVRMVDAPVTGSSPRAQDATLTIMVGGDPQDVARAEPLLATMGSLVVRAGALGQGQTIKLLNNALAAANAAALAEALTIAARVGVDLDALVQVAAAGSGSSTMLALKSEPMRARRYDTLFKTAHMPKDVSLALDVAAEAGTAFPSAAHAAELLAAAVDRGFADADFAALIEPVIDPDRP